MQQQERELKSNVALLMGCILFSSKRLIWSVAAGARGRVVKHGA